MAPTKILEEKLRDYLIFPDLLPYRNSLYFGIAYLADLRKRLCKQKWKYRFPPPHIPALEVLPFYENMIVGEGENKDEVTVKKVLEFYQHDREAIVGAMEVVESEHIGMPLQGERVFWEFHSRYLGKALQDVSKEKGDGSYVITVAEIPGLEPEEGMKLLIEKIVSRYRVYNKIPEDTTPTPESVEPVSGTEDQTPPSFGEEERTLEQEKEELAQQVEKLKEEAGIV